MKQNCVKFCEKLEIFRRLKRVVDMKVIFITPTEKPRLWYEFAFTALQIIIIFSMAFNTFHKVEKFYSVSFKTHIIFWNFWNISSFNL